MELYKEAIIDSLIQKTLEKVIHRTLPHKEIFPFFKGMTTSLEAIGFINSQEQEKLLSFFEQTYCSTKFSKNRSMTFLFEIGYGKTTPDKLLYYHAWNYIQNKEIMCEIYHDYVVNYDSVSENLFHFFLCPDSTEKKWKNIQYTDLQKCDDALLSFFADQPPIIITSFSSQLSYTALPPGKYIIQIVSKENIESFFEELYGKVNFDDDDGNLIIKKA